MIGIFTFFIPSSVSTGAWINDLLSLLLLDPLFPKPSAVTANFYLCLFVFGLAFFSAQWIIPQAIQFAHRFQLMDHPDFRKKHSKSTPILG
jgi:hypothetical protein